MALVSAALYIPTIVFNCVFIYFYPHAFFKKGREYCNRLRPSVCPLCYHPLNHWTKFNQIWYVSYSHEWGVQRQTFYPPPGAPGRGQKVKYHLISITKSISKICVPNFVCGLTNERYKAYQMGFSFCRLGGTLGRWGAQGVKYYFTSNMVNWHIKSTGTTSRAECT